MFSWTVLTKILEVMVSNHTFQTPSQKERIEWVGDMNLGHVAELILAINSINVKFDWIGFDNAIEGLRRCPVLNAIQVPLQSRTSRTSVSQFKRQLNRCLCLYEVKIPGRQAYKKKMATYWNIRLSPDSLVAMCELLICHPWSLGITINLLLFHSILSQQ